MWEMCAKNQNMIKRLSLVIVCGLWLGKNSGDKAKGGLEMKLSIINTTLIETHLSYSNLFCLQSHYAWHNKGDSLFNRSKLAALHPVYAHSLVQWLSQDNLPGSVTLQCSSAAVPLITEDGTSNVAAPGLSAERYHSLDLTIHDQITHKDRTALLIV